MSTKTWITISAIIVLLCSAIMGYQTVKVNRLNDRLEIARIEVQQIREDNLLYKTQIIQEIMTDNLDRMQNLIEENEDLREILGMILQDEEKYMEKYGLQFEQANKDYGVEWTYPPSPESYYKEGSE